MMQKRVGIWRGLLLVAFLAASGIAQGGEPPEAPGEPEQGTAVEDEGIDETTPEIVAKVDGVTITRRDLALLRRQLAAARRKSRAPLPNNQVLLERLIDRVLWRRYFEDEDLLPPADEIPRAIKRLDNELRRRGASYAEFLAARGLNAEEHAQMIAYNLAMRKLQGQIGEEITEEELKAEFEARPEFYDGSRIRISQVFIDTSDIGNDPEALKKAKERIADIHAQLKAGKDFERLASDLSEGPAASRGGDRGWWRRKVPNEDDESLMEAAWKLKVGDITEPIRGTKGWHIIKVTDREPAYFTYFGARRAIMSELVRQRLEKILAGLKEKAKIEKFM
ncbi:MAG: peptidylprolyl isomerase [Candidatus Brocadiia bacterium]